MPTFRPARREDIPAIIQLLNDDRLGAQRESLSDPEPYLKAFARIENDPNNELIVAELDGRVIGMLHLTYIQYLSFQGSRAAVAESVRIAREQRNQGHGRQMMIWAIERARAKGCHRIQLTTNKVRKDAHRFYSSLGFEATHEGMKLYFDAGVT
jgi:GNAT superfamily N-acetyltransferase